jgi:hypothetical protein
LDARQTFEVSQALACKKLALHLPWFLGSPGATECKTIQPFTQNQRRYWSLRFVHKNKSRQGGF